MCYESDGYIWYVHECIVCGYVDKNVCTCNVLYRGQYAIVSFAAIYFDSYINLPMLRLPSSKVLGYKHIWKPSKPCHVGIHEKALTE